MALTKRQKEVLDFIADFVEENGYSPSYEELAQGLQLASLATVHKHIQALESRNYLRRLFNQSRSLEVSAKYVQERRKGRASWHDPARFRSPAASPQARPSKPSKDRTRCSSPTSRARATRSRSR